jgi:hypothetical protein
VSRSALSWQHWISPPPLRTPVDLIASYSYCYPYRREFLIRFSKDTRRTWNF